MTKTTAQHVRTGHVITTDYARPRTLEVAYVIRDRFTNPEGTTFERFRFSGWDDFGQWREASFGVAADSRVYLLADHRGQAGCTYGAL